MLAINIDGISVFTNSLIQQVTSRYSLSISNIPKNINKATIAIIFFCGLANITMGSSNFDNESCKELCVFFFKGRNIKVMDNCLHFCDLTHPT